MTKPLPNPENLKTKTRFSFLGLHNRHLLVQDETPGSFMSPSHFSMAKKIP